MTNNLPLQQSVVLDTSVIIKWFHREQELDVEAALTLRKAFLDSALDITVPDLLLYEFSNVMRYKPSYSAQDVSAMIEALYLSDITINQVDQQLIFDSISLAEQFNVSVYDASFVTLAQRLSAGFITADRKLYERIKDIDTVIRLSDLAS